MFVFLIDTNIYAGNFEREMTAYITGVVGDCGVGTTEAKVAQDVYDPFDIIEQEPDDTGCYRPCKIWPTEGYFQHGLGGSFKEAEEEVAKKEYRRLCLEEAKKYYAPSQVQQKNRWLIKADEPLQKYPAYNSVGILLSREPTEEELRIFKERALTFFDYVQEDDSSFLNKKINSKGVDGTIESFRLVEIKTVTSQLNKWEI